MVVEKIHKEKERAISRLSFGLIKKLLRKLREEEAEPLLEAVGDMFDSVQGSFSTFHSRPKSALDVNTWSEDDGSATAIILQGPILHKDDFTLETVKMYRRHYPETDVIVSTWENEDETVLKELESIGAKVVASQPPENPGPSNVNYQIISSRAGVELASAGGSEYVLKSRTDQRFYTPGVMAFLINMINTFPASGGYDQKKRVLGLSLNSFKYRLYGLSDMFVFGTVSEMLKFWGCPLDSRTSPPFSDEVTMYEQAKAAVAEVYLTSKYLEKIGYDLKWSLADSWKAFSEVFCIVDRESVDLYWPKYSKMEYWHKSYDHIRTNHEMSFLEWLNIFQGVPSLSDNEEILQLKMRDVIPEVK